MALSEVDASLLQRYGHDTIRDVLGAISETAFCSAYGIFFALAMYSIHQKGLRSRRRIIMSLVVVYLYAASLTQWAVYCLNTIKNIYCLYMTTEVPLLDRAELYNQIQLKFLVFQEALFDFNMIVADAVVIWRTWAVYQGRLTAIAMPCVILLAGFVFSLIDVTCISYDGSTPLPGGETICPWTSLLVWSFSLATNVVCTLLISWKAWYHRKMMKELNMGGKNCGMSAENILWLLVESGFIYSGVWAIQIIGPLNVVKPYSAAYYLVFVLMGPGLGQQLTGIYPTIIIVIVNFKRTIWDEYPDRTTITSLKWAANTNPSGTTNTVDSRAEVGINLETVSEVLPESSRIYAHKQLAAEDIALGPSGLTDM